MKDLFYQGNLFSMIGLTLLLLIIIVVAIYRAIQISRDEVPHPTLFRHQLTRIKSIGLFALIFGFFAFFLYIYQGFSFIEAAGGGAVSPVIVARGIKLMITPTLYGSIIFLLSYLIWLGLDMKLDSRLSGD